MDDEYQVVLFGLKPDTEYLVWARVEVDDEIHTSSAMPFHTGYASVELAGNPSVLRDPERATDGFFVTMAASARWTALIMDQDYDYVWWYSLDTGQATALRARLSRDRQSVLVQGDHVLWRISIDGETEEELPIDSHHDFVELADGTLAVLDQVEEQIGDVNVIGDRIVEYAPSGESRVVWTTFDSFEYDPDALLEFPDMFMGWSHANVLRYDAERDRYAVSVRNFHTIVTIDRETGEELYRIGGTDSDVVSSTGETSLFYGQHGFELEADRLLIYDNGSPERNSTMIVEFGIDLDAGTADRHFDYKPNPPLYNPVAGDVTRLPSGNTLITWSYLGRIEELSTDGAIVGQLQMPIGNGFGYTSWVEDLYTATGEALTPGEAGASASAR